MKKNYLLIFFLLILTAGMAQSKKSHLPMRLAERNFVNGAVKLDSKPAKANMPVKATMCAERYVSSSFSSIQEALKAKQNAAAADPYLIYGRPDGTMFEGFTRDYNSYQTYSFLHSPSMTPVDYVPYTNLQNPTFQWNYNDGNLFTPIDDPVDPDGTLHFTSAITRIGYVSYLPKVTATSGDNSLEYVIGEEVDKQYLFSSYVERTLTEDGTEFDGAEEFAPLTLANMHANRPTSANLYGGFTAGGAFSPSYTNADGPCKGIMQVIPQLKSPMYVESISALAYTEAYTEGGEAVPEGGIMKLQLYYINEDGSLGKLIGESSTSEFAMTYEDQGAFIFKFQEEEDGFIVDTPIVLGTDGPIAVVFTGFDSSWDFNFLFGGNTIQGSSYTLHGDNLKVSTFGYSNAPTVPRTDLYIQFNGIYNCLAPIDENYASLTFPAEGGLGISGYDESDGSAYNDLSLYSSFNADDDMTNITIESAPEWVTSVEYDSTYFEDYSVVSFYFTASALPAGVSGRTGEIVLSSYGVSLKIPVSQGGSSSINNTKDAEVKAFVENSAFALNYPSGYTKVTVLNLSGQQLGVYDLSPSGQTKIPAAFNKGVYLLKFTGNKTKTVKISR